MNVFLMLLAIGAVAFLGIPLLLSILATLYAVIRYNSWPWGKNKFSEYVAGKELKEAKGRRKYFNESVETNVIYFEDVLEDRKIRFSIAPDFYFQPLQDPGLLIEGTTALSPRDQYLMGRALLREHRLRVAAQHAEEASREARRVEAEREKLREIGLP